MALVNISDDDQQRYLADAIKVVREQAFYMKRAIDGDNLKISLDHATEVSSVVTFVTLIFITHHLLYYCLPYCLILIISLLLLQLLDVT